MSDPIKTIKASEQQEGNIKGFFEAEAGKINVSGYGKKAAEYWSGIKKVLEGAAETGVAQDVRMPYISGYALATTQITPEKGSELELKLYPMSGQRDDKTLTKCVEDSLVESGLSFEYVVEKKEGRQN